MTITLGINGFGRIGRSTLMHIAEKARQDVRVVKVNATGPLETAAHLVRYDSVHGRFRNEVKIGNGTMDLGHGEMQMMSTYNMDELDWSGVDVVLECTGNFNDGDKCQKHLERGAKAVLISAPAKNVQKTIVMGVNDSALAHGDVMISNGSCTTNCLAPVAKVLHENIGIESGIMTASSRSFPQASARNSVWPGWVKPTIARSVLEIGAVTNAAASPSAVRPAPSTSEWSARRAPDWSGWPGV